MFRLKLSSFRKDTLKRTENEFDRLALVAGEHPDKVRFTFCPSGWFLAELPAGQNPRTRHEMLKAFNKREEHLLATTDRTESLIEAALKDLNELGFRSVPAAFDHETEPTIYVLGGVSGKTLRDLERVSYDTVIKRCARLRVRDVTHAFNHAETAPNPEINRLLSLLARDEKWEKAHARFRTASPMRNADRISGYYEAVHRYNLEARAKRLSGTPAQAPSV